VRNIDYLREEQQERELQKREARKKEREEAQMKWLMDEASQLFVCGKHHENDLDEVMVSILKVLSEIDHAHIC
jgi:hypothetical protein